MSLAVVCYFSVELIDESGRGMGLCAKNADRLFDYGAQLISWPAKQLQLGAAAIVCTGFSTQDLRKITNNGHTPCYGANKIITAQRASRVAD